jgi:hypothetical protein
MMMLRMSALTIAMALVVSNLGAAPRVAGTKAVTWTGWFSDQQCARVREGDVRPNNPDCVRRCLNEGSKAVFISEQARALFIVKDYPTVKENVGHHIELTGIVDEAAKTISVQSVRRLSAVAAMCAVPRKSGKN